MARLSYECDVCVLGGPGIGKSSLILHYTKGIFFEDIESSVEDLYQKQATSQGVSKMISILDTNAYVDAYSTSRKEQIKNAATLVFAYSIDDRDSFLKVSDDFERILGVMKTLPPCALIGLKSDLSSDRQVACEEGQRLSEQMKAVSFRECSSKLAINVNEALDPIVEAALKNSLKSEAKSEARSEEKINANYKMKSETKSDLNVDLKSDMTFDEESEANSEAKSDAKSEVKTEMKTEMKSGSSTPQTVERKSETLLRSTKKAPSSPHHDHCCIIM